MVHNKLSCEEKNAGDAPELFGYQRGFSCELWGTFIQSLGTADNFSTISLKSPHLRIVNSVDFASYYENYPAAKAFNLIEFRP